MPLIHIIEDGLACLTNLDDLTRLFKKLAAATPGMEVREEDVSVLHSRARSITLQEPVFIWLYLDRKEGRSDEVVNRLCRGIQRLVWEFTSISTFPERKVICRPIAFEPEDTDTTEADSEQQSSEPQPAGN